MSADLSEAIELVRQGHAQRICEPGKWVVSREQTITVRHLGEFDMAQTPKPKPKPTTTRPTGG